MHTVTTVRRTAWWRSGARLLVALALPIVPVSAGLGVVAASAPPRPAACATPHEHGIPERIQQVAPPASAPTAVDHYARGSEEREEAPLRGAIEAVRRKLVDYGRVAAGTLPSSGIEVEVLADGPLEVSLEELDRLLVALLRPETPYGDPTVDAWMACNARRVLDERVLAGDRLRLLVPSNPHTCFRAARFTTDPHGGCDSHGVSLPEIDARPQVLGFTLARLEAPSTIAIAPGEPYAVEAATRAARLLVHEFVHYVDNELGNPPWAGSLRRYEQRAYFVERTLAERAPRDWLMLPRPVRFPEGRHRVFTGPGVLGVL